MSDLERLLIETSRTFALSIPYLPEPVRQEVTLAYLLFRIADTFEDAAVWSKQDRIQALEDFCALLADPSEEQARRQAERWVRMRPSEHAGYLHLLSHVPMVLQHFREVREPARDIIEEHTRRTAQGMAKFLARSDSPEVELRDFQDLRDYCYVVAGIVGEMLTELYLLNDQGLTRVGSYLRARAASFGEALQLTNILKDASVDVSEGRNFLPSREILGRAFRQAREDLDRASEYTLALQEAEAESGIVGFNALPLRLARATLDRVEEKPGSKLTRPEVFAIVAQLNRALESGEPVVECSSPTPVLEAER